MDFLHFLVCCVHDDKTLLNAERKEERERLFIVYHQRHHLSSLVSIIRLEMAAQIRLSKELKEVAKKDVAAGVQATQIGDSERHLLGTIIGSEGTPYEGGVFDIDIVIPQQYPFEPPKMKFITKIWHPNISSQTGAICLVSFMYQLLPVQYDQ